MYPVVERNNDWGSVICSVLLEAGFYVSVQSVQFIGGPFMSFPVDEVNGVAVAI